MAASGKGLDRAGYVLVVAALVAWRLVAADFGSLRVESDADVEVVWEGVSLGTTNELGTMVIGDIPLGDYTVILKKNGFETRRVAVVVAGGETVLSLKLAAEQPPEEAEVIEPEPRIIEARPPAEQV